MIHPPRSRYLGCLDWLQFCANVKKAVCEEKKEKQTFFLLVLGKTQLCPIMPFFPVSLLYYSHKAFLVSKCGFFFSHTNQFSAIPPEYPIILVSSDTFYLKKAWQSKAQVINCASEQKIVDRRFPKQDKTKPNPGLN